MPSKKDYVVGTDNVFADLGYPRPEEATAKAELAHKISKIIERRGLTQAHAAEILDVDQPKISALRRGKLVGFSLDRGVPLLRVPWGRSEGARQLQRVVGAAARHWDGARVPMGNSSRYR